MRSLPTRLAAAAALAAALTPAAAADTLIAERADVREAIRKARAYLTSTGAKSPGMYRELIAYALLKSGGKETDPFIKETIDEIIEGVAGGRYEKAPSGDRMYATGLEAMLLADSGGEKYLPELEVIRDYIIEYQNDDGSWSYTKNLKSDVSVTQYAVLGLWAAERAGARVPEEVWGRVAMFHVRAQQADGGYPYIATTGAVSTKNMTAAGMASLAIAQRHLPKSRGKSGGSPADEGAAAVTADGETLIVSTEGVVRYGILMPVDEEAERLAEEKRKQEAAEAARAAEEEAAREAEAERRRDEPQVVAGVANGPLTRAAGHLSKVFAQQNPSAHHATYWFYALERAASLTSREKVGGVDWYNVTADQLLTRQQPDGNWRFPGSYYPPAGDTAFILLFLSRPTAKFAKFRPPENRLAGGLLAGGRGLPTDLSDFGKPERKKAKTGLEKLLADLSEAEATQMPDLQEKLVEEIQLADRDELVGQTQTLVKLVDHKNPEVRRTVLWAIGRTGDLRLARYALAALDDADLGVLTEARNALAWIARTPDAKGFPESPLDGVPAGASVDERVKAVQRWQDGMWEAWGRWYLDRSPYEDRFDEFELDLRARLGRR